MNMRAETVKVVECQLNGSLAECLSLNCLSLWMTGKEY